jgi:hypothetical protein
MAAHGGRNLERYIIVKAGCPPEADQPRAEKPDVLATTCLPAGRDEGAVLFEIV